MATGYPWCYCFVITPVSVTIVVVHCLYIYTYCQALRPCQKNRAQRLHKRQRQSPVSDGSANEASLIADWDFDRRVAVLQTSTGESLAKRMQAAQPNRKDKSQVEGIFDLDGKEVAVPVGMVWWGLVSGVPAIVPGPRGVVRAVQAKPRRKAKSRRLAQGHVEDQGQQIQATEPLSFAFVHCIYLF